MERYKSELDINPDLRREVTLEVERNKVILELQESRTRLITDTRRFLAAIGLLIMLAVIPQTQNFLGLIIFILIIPSILKDTNLHRYTSSWRNLRIAKKQLREWDRLIEDYREYNK